MQYPHLLDDRRFARLAGAEQQQPVRGPVHLLVLLQLFGDRITAALLRFRVLGGVATAGAGCSAASRSGRAGAAAALAAGLRLLGAGRTEAPHGCPRRPPAGGGGRLGWGVGRLGGDLPRRFAVASQPIWCGPGGKEGGRVESLRWSRAFGVWLAGCAG